MEPLSRREKELLGFIRAHVEGNGFGPSVEEMTVFLGIKSKSNAQRMLDRIVWAGYLKRLPRRARGIELVQTKDYHRVDCNCVRCAEARYRAQMKFIEALKVEAPIALANATGTNLRDLSQATRDSLLGRLPDTAGSRKRPAVPSGRGL